MRYGTRGVEIWELDISSLRYVSGSYQLCDGFVSGLSSGDANTAFFCAAYGIHFSVISGGKDLASLLKEIDYYIHLLKTYLDWQRRKKWR